MYEVFRESNWLDNELQNAGFMVAKIGAPEKILCKLPLSEELADAGLAGDTLDARFEEIQKLIAALG